MKTQAILLCAVAAAALAFAAPARADGYFEPQPRAKPSHSTHGHVKHSRAKHGYAKHGYAEPRHRDSIANIDADYCAHYRTHYESYCDGGAAIIAGGGYRTPIYGPYYYYSMPYAPAPFIYSSARPYPLVHSRPVFGLGIRPLGFGFHGPGHGFRH